MRRDQYEDEMVSRLDDAVGNWLLSVVVYGPAAHDDAYAAIPGVHMMIVVSDLSLDTVQRLGEPVRWWLKKGEPWPRLFSPELLASSTDIYPIEMLALAQHRRVIFGSDPVTDLEVDRAHLRVQCERELREKLMRLREGYIMCHGRTEERDLHELLGLSYASFVPVFRGCLFLLDAPAADRDLDVVRTLCEWLDLPPDSFAAADRIARGHRGGDIDTVFAGYYRDLTTIAERVDRLIIHPHRRAP